MIRGVSHIAVEETRFSRPLSAELGWAGLACSDPVAAIRFYADLLGCQPWTASGGVTAIGNDDATVAVVYAQRRPAQAAGVSSHWTPFVSVRDAGEAQAAAVRLGAFALCEPFDVAHTGRIAPIRDPVGATVSLWEAAGPEGFDVGEGKSDCWHELVTEDIDRARDFYSDLFAWSLREHDEGLATIMTSDRAIGAVRQADGSVSGGAGWFPWFSVMDVNGCRRKAEQLGARPLEPLDWERSPPFRDPQGAVFGLFEEAIF